MNRVARLSSVLRLTVTVLAWLILLATIPFLVWVAVYGNADLAQGVNVPVSDLPLLPVVLFLALYTLRSLVMVVALLSLRRILNHFGREQFFTRECVVAFRRIGVQLVALAAIDVLTPVITYAALAVTEPRFDPTDVWILLTDLPFMPLVGGLFALIMAHVLGQAADLAEDAALTV
ncbi:MULTISPECIES: DUF2975 domain-containing protein [unclassified Inquilinus]|uniref:DUF2975 domain-containing protein n=1 Tax=unclassified Inquilinus TaxID=2645927 RepID=UPI003F8EC75C